MTRVLKTIFLFIVSVCFCISIASCGNNATAEKSISSEKKVKSIQKIEEDRIDGTYTYHDNSAELEILIVGDSWSGKTIMISGFGSDYVNKQAQYENGIVKGNDLFDSSGLIKIGSVNGKSLSTSIVGQSVTLRK